MKHKERQKIFRIHIEMLKFEDRISKLIRPVEYHYYRITRLRATTFVLQVHSITLGIGITKVINLMEHK